MAYQIPQQLEYKEKIMFGLTFKQLAYAFLFGGVALILFNKLDNTYLRFTLALIPSILGLGFMFLDFDVHLKNYWGYINFRKVYANDPKLDMFIGVESINDNVIVTSKNIHKIDSD